MKRALALVLLVLTVGAMGVGPAGAQEPTPIGFPILNAPGWWKLLNGGSQADVLTGPALAGWGTRSLRMTTGTEQSVASTDLVFVPGITNISSIVELSYWTYAVPVGNPNVSAKAPSLQLSVDVDGDLMWDTNLVYEPSFNAPVVFGQWQQWDTLAGVWYSTRNIGFADQNNPATLSEIFQNTSYEMTFSLLPSDPGGDLRLQFGSSGGGYPGNIARADGIEFQVGALPEIQTDFEDPAAYVQHLVAGTGDDDATPWTPGQ